MNPTSRMEKRKEWRKETGGRRGICSWNHLYCPCKIKQIGLGGGEEKGQVLCLGKGSDSRPERQLPAGPAPHHKDAHPFCATSQRDTSPKPTLSPFLMHSLPRSQGTPRPGFGVLLMEGRCNSVPGAHTDLPFITLHRARDPTYLFSPRRPAAAATS